VGGDEANNCRAVHVGHVAVQFPKTRLCRCGQSRNKPFCDLSHVAAGFQADGS